MDSPYRSPQLRLAALRLSYFNILFNFILNILFKYIIFGIGTRCNYVHGRGLPHNLSGWAPVLGFAVITLGSFGLAMQALTAHPPD